MIGGGDECFMDRQYEYVFADDTDHHGFVSHHSGERADPVVKKGIRNLNFGSRISPAYRRQGMRN
jgi:hypothetical protein